MTKPLLLLWTDGAAPSAAAIEAAGLDGRLRVETLPRAATPSDAQLAEAEALLSWGPPPGMLTRMPKLRFVQALTAGVEHWLSRPDLAPDLALSCARGTHRVQMPENILGALFHITKPYAAIAGDNAAKQWTRRVSTTLAGKTLGILGLGAIGVELARKAEALEMHVIGTRRGSGDLPHVDRVYRPEETEQVLAASDFVVLLLPATPAEHLHPSRARPCEAQHHLHQRRLAGAVVADQRRQHALRQGKGNLAHGLHLAIALRHLFQRDDRCVRPHGRHPGAASGTGGGTASGWLSTTPPGRIAGNCDCAQRRTCTAGLFSRIFARGAVQSTRSTMSFGR